MSEFTEHIFLLYEAGDNDVIANVLVKGETLCTTQKEMARMFDINISIVNEHLKNIYNPLSIRGLPSQRLPILLLLKY